MRETKTDFETQEITRTEEREVTDYETVEIEKEVLICDACNVTVEELHSVWFGVEVDEPDTHKFIERIAQSGYHFDDGGPHARRTRASLRPGPKIDDDRKRRMRRELKAMNESSVFAGIDAADGFHIKPGDPIDLRQTYIPIAELKQGLNRLTDDIDVGANAERELCDACLETLDVTYKNDVAVDVREHQTEPQTRNFTKVFFMIAIGSALMLISTMSSVPVTGLGLIFIVAACVKLMNIEQAAF